MAKVKKAKTFRTASGEGAHRGRMSKLADEFESDAPVVFTGDRGRSGGPRSTANGASPRVSFRVPPDLYDAAAERATRSERTVSDADPGGAGEVPLG